MPCPPPMSSLMPWWPLFPESGTLCGRKKSSLADAWGQPTMGWLLPWQASLEGGRVAVAPRTCCDTSPRNALG